ncbi:rhodanese-like domain-containing protein [Sungkyunkwania multivorans]|uniref:Rhodanese-like domain-containing protein n=1 Tax=Sungkyunkwania multivorans TaxID=1173618 RepID=A0ABW3D125_9FLAO
MRIIFYISVFCLFSVSFAQESIEAVLQKFNTDSIPYIKVDELKALPEKPILLDAREADEYEVSHLKDALYVGYQNFQLENVSCCIKDKERTIVVYCSVGVRSEDIAFKLKKAGYKNVFNLWGGIFEWKNHGQDVFNLNLQKTDSVHVFSKAWEPYLKNGIKVY